MTPRTEACRPNRPRHDDHRATLPPRGARDTKASSARHRSLPAPARARLRRCSRRELVATLAIVTRRERHSGGGAARNPRNAAMISSRRVRRELIRKAQKPRQERWVSTGRSFTSRRAAGTPAKRAQTLSINDSTALGIQPERVDRDAANLPREKQAVYRTPPASLQSWIRP
jgi:hypothetical protein